MNNLFLFLIISISSTLFFTSPTFGQNAGPAELKTVLQVDLKRDGGKWYEIARYPNRFQSKCAGDVNAQYTLKANGRIEVRNECLKKNGKKQVAVGEAKVTDEITKAKLKVRFAPSFLSFLPFVWGDYWIIDLDVNYEWSRSAIRPVLTSGSFVGNQRSMKWHIRRFLVESNPWVSTRQKS